MIKILPPRTPFLDESTGLMAREWYRFFEELQELFNIDTLTLVAISAIVEDLQQIVPTVRNFSPDIQRLERLVNGIEMLGQSRQNLDSVLKRIEVLEAMQITKPNLHPLEKRIENIESLVGA